MQVSKQGSEELLPAVPPHDSESAISREINWRPAATRCAEIWFPRLRLPISAHNHCWATVAVGKDRQAKTFSDGLQATMGGGSCGPPSALCPCHLVELFAKESLLVNPNY